MKKTLYLLIIVLLSIFTAGCREKKEAADSVTVTDHAGYSITVPAEIKKVVVCDILPLPSVLSIFFDSAEKIAGISSSSMAAAENSLLSELYPEILKAETGFIKGSNVNVEELMKLEPDVVFYSASHPELGKKLRTSGFNAVAVSVNKWEYNTIETLNNWITLLSQIFPENDRSKKVRDYSNEIYNMVQDRVSNIPEEKRRNVFFLFRYNDSTIMTSGRLFFGEWWAEASGAVNVAEALSKDNSIKVNLEQIYAWNPDIIFITNFTTAQPEDLYNNTVGPYNWSGINAVNDKRVYKMPLGMYRSYTPGIDTPITLLWMAKTIYPELFKDISFTEKVISYYKSVFDVTLTKDQAESIFSPVSDAGSVNF